MNRWLDAKPDNDATVFDMLHALFGVGDYDYDGQPWWELRMKEAVRIRALRGSRAVSIDDLALAIRYAATHRVPISASWQVFGHIPAAKAEAALERGLSAQVDKAIARERAFPGPESELWLGRLLMTRGPFRKTLLDEWKSSRNPPTEGT